MIYFIACREANAVKIGLTRKRPYARLGTAQVNCPLELELLATCDGDEAEEFALHQRFDALRMRGEWFRLTPELEAHICKFPKPEQLPRGWHGQQRNRKAA